MGSLWNRSGTIERYADDLPADGALAYFYIGGTTTPLIVYRDAGESAAHTHPVVADARGRWPDVFVPYALGYDVRVTTAAGVQLSFTLGIPNPDPINLTVTIDAEEKVTTGTIIASFGVGDKAGYVRLNGQTIGNAASGATERANADTVDLFTQLWDRLSNTLAPVSGGRGASAAADYAANKTITLPDARGTVFVGVNDMGAAPDDRFAGLIAVAGDKDSVGSTFGANSIILTEAQLPPHKHTVNTIGGAPNNDLAIEAEVVAASDVTTIDSGSVGDGELIDNMQRSLLVTWYIRL